MNSRTMRFLFVLSIVLNVAVVAGFAYESFTGVPIQAARTASLQDWVREVRLTEQQKVLLERLIAEQLPMRRKRVEDILVLRRQVAAQMATGTPDLALIERNIDEVLRIRAEQVKDNFRSILEFEKHLTPEQRKRLEAMMGDQYIAPPGAGGRPGETLMGVPPTGRARGLPGGPELQ